MDPFIEDVPGAGEVVGPLQPGRVRELLYVAADLGEVIDAGPSQRVRGAHLQQHVDEGARLEIRAVEPVGEHVEDGEERWSGVSALRRASPIIV